MRRSPHARSPMAVPRAPWRWAALGLCLGALPALALWAPARWLAGGVQQASGGQLQLQQAQGTVWTGSARLVLTGGAGSEDQAALPGRVRWRLRPAWGGAQAEIAADCCTAQPLTLRAALGLGALQLQITDGQSQWPAGVLAGLGTPWNTIQPQGELAVGTQGLQIEWLAGRMHLQGRAEITARQLSSRLSTLQPMGSYRLEVRGGDAVALALSTLEGGLQLSGSGQWVGTRLHFSGEAHAAPGLEAQLANLLNIIGRRQGDRAVISLG